MAGIMIYVPGADQVPPQTLTELGLGDLLEPGIAPLAMPPGGKTPDGGTGKLVVFDCPSRPELTTPHVIDLASQEWIPAPPSGDLAAGRYWVGFVVDAPPGPSELARRTICDGEAILLADGRSWTVPIARYLPQRLTRDPKTGQEVTAATAQHREFSNRATDLFCYFMSDEFQDEVSQNGRVRIPNGLEFAALALAKNYRVNIDVVDALGLVSEWEAFDIARVASGLPAVVHDGKPPQKKSPPPPNAAASSTR